VASRVSRRLVPTPLARFLVAFVLGSAITFGVASAVPAASFDDTTPCPHPGGDPALVCPGGEVGKPYSLQLTGKAGCDLYWWENPQGALPPGLTLTSSGLISGTPTTAGIARFWIIIHDLLPEQGGNAWCGADNKSEREHIIQIQPGLVVTTESAPVAFTGTQYSLSVAAAMQTAPGQTTPPTAAPAWSVAEGQLPPGLGLDASTGVISGMPTTDGAYGFVVRAALTDGRSATKALSIEVKTALVLAPPESIPASEVGVPVRIALGATGGTPPYTWTLLAGALPTGVALTAAGTIAGRPTTAGTFPFTASVADSGGQSQSYSGTLFVAPRLAIVKVKLRPARVGKKYRAKLFATGGVAPRLWVVMRGPLPRGVRLDRQLGVLSGIPKKAGRYRLRLQVADSLGVRSTKSYLIVVAPAPKPKPKPKR
jgi:large repetitive protein